MTLTTQFYTLLAMIGMGSYFGAALDTYTRFLKRSSSRAWLIFINDFLFWLIQGLIIFYVLFLVNEGELRLYLFLALLCGFAAYQALFKTIYKKMLELGIDSFIKTVRLFNKIVQTLIFSPIKWIITSSILLLVGIAKLVFSIFKWIFKVVLSILLVFLKPVFWLFEIFWNKLPKKLKLFVVKIYNKITGLFTKLKNVLNSIVKRIRK